MAPRGQQIDAISVGLGLDLGQLKADISAGKRELEQLAAGKKTNIPVKLDMRDFSTQVNRAAKQVRTQIGEAVEGVNKAGLKITPRFTVSAGSLRSLRTDVNQALRQAASQGQAISLPVKVAMSANDARKMRAEIERQLNAQPISIGLNWHWNTPPPSGGTAGGSGAPQPGPAPRRGGGAASPPPAASPAPQPRSGGVAARAPRSAQAPAPATPVVSGSRPRPTAPASARTSSPVAAPVVGVTTTAAPAASSRMSIDSLRGRDIQYTPAEKLAHAYERGTPVRHRGEVTSGVRGAGVAGTNMTFEDRQAWEVLMRPENVAKRNAARGQYEKMVQARRRSDAVNRGYVAAQVQRGDFPAGGTGDIAFQEARARAERVRVSAAKAQAISKAMAGVKFDRAGVPNIDELHALDPQMAAVVQAFTLGDNPTAAALSKDMVVGLGLPDVAMSDAPGSLQKALGKQSRARRRLGKTLGAEVDVDRMDQVTLLKQATGAAIMRLVGVEKMPTSASRRATSRKGQANRDRGFLNVHDQEMADSSYGKLLKRQLGINKANPILDENDEPYDLPVHQLENLARARGLKTSRLRPTRVDTDANEYRAALDLLKPRLMGRAGGGPIGPWSYDANSDFIRRMNRLSSAEKQAITPEQRQQYIAAHQARVSHDQAARGYTPGQQQAPPPDRGSSRIEKLERMASQLASPNEAVVAKSLLKRIRGFAGGGLLERLLESTLTSGGSIKPGQEARSHDLNRLVGMKRGGTSSSGGAMLPGAIVGERGPEYVVPEQDSWVIPNHLMHMLPKRAAGGPISGNQGGTLRFRAHGSFQSGGAAAAAGIQTGLASAINTGISRVFVTNWPPLITQSVSQGMPVGPARARVGQPILGSTPVAGAEGAPRASRSGAQTAEQRKAVREQERLVKDQLKQQQQQLNSQIRSATARTPLARVEARQAALGSVESLSDRLSKASTDISEALQASPVRALSVSIGQIAQNAIGGRQDILSRAGTARTLAGRAQRQVSFLQGREEDVQQLLLTRRDLRANVPGLPKAELRELLTQNRTALQLAIRGVRAQRPFAERATAEAEAAAGGIVNKRQQFRAQAIGLAGIVGGTFLFGAAMQAAQFVIEQFTKAAGPAIDALSGFGQTAGRVSAGLAETIRQQRGQGNVAFAQTTGAIGFNADFARRLGPLLDFSERMAGSQQVQSQVDALRANQFAKTTGVGRGLGTGFGNGPLGFLSGLPFGIGGLGSIGQTPGIAEQLTNQLPENRSGFAGGITSRGGPNLLEGLGKDAIDGLNALGDVFGNGNSTIVAQQQAQDLATANDTLTAFNDNVKRVSAGFGKIDDVLDPAKLKAANDALAQTGDSGKDLAGRLQALGKAIVLPGGNAITTPEQANQFLQAGAAGASKFDPAQMLAASQNALEASVRGIGRQANFQRETAIPANFALQQLQNPQPTNALQGIAPIGGGAGTFGGGFAAPDQGTITAVTTYTQAITDARTQISALAAEGQQKLRDLGVPQSEIDSVKALGQNIADLRNQAENLQLAQQQTSYNRELMIQRRTVGDLVGLEGKSAAQVRSITGYTADGAEQYQQQVVAATQLGRLQRAQLEDQRAGAVAQLAINRREIEFGIAVSRLSTPGSTPEERAARRQEADLIAQEQLAQQRRAERTTKRGFKIEDIGISRQAQDAIAALQQLQAGHALEIQIRGIEKVVSADQQLLDLKTSMLSVSKDAGTQLQQLALDTQQQIEAETGQFNDAFGAEVDASLKTLVDKYKTQLEGLLPGSTGAGTPNVNPQTGFTLPAHAQGASFDTNGATQFIAGEAGREHVVVIKNPRRGGLAGMSGYQILAPVTVTFGDVSVRDQGDIDDIVAKVEQAMNRRAALLGLSRS